MVYLEIEVGKKRSKAESTMEMKGCPKGLKKKGRVVRGCEEGVHKMVKASSQPCQSQ